jgi:hypothetical protein
MRGYNEREMAGGKMAQVNMQSEKYNDTQEIHVIHYSSNKEAGGYEHQEYERRFRGMVLTSMKLDCNTSH